MELEPTSSSSSEISNGSSSEPTTNTASSSDAEKTSMEVDDNCSKGEQSSEEAPKSHEGTSMVVDDTKSDSTLSVSTPSDTNVISYNFIVKGGQEGLGLDNKTKMKRIWLIAVRQNSFLRVFHLLL